MYLFSFQARLPSTSVHKFTVSIKASISPLEFPSRPSSYAVVRVHLPTLSTLSSSHILHPLHVSPNESPLRTNSRKRYSILRVYILFVQFSHVCNNSKSKFTEHHLYICHLSTGGKTSDRKIRRGWCCAGNHASGRASSAPQGRVHHSRCMHTGHNNDFLHYMDLVFRPSGQTKGNLFLLIEQWQLRPQTSSPFLLPGPVPVDSLNVFDILEYWGKVFRESWKFFSVFVVKFSDTL